MNYFRSTENFKSHFSQHKSTFTNRPKALTTLLSYIWKLKDANIPFEVKCSIVKKGHAFSSGSKACDLFLTEKLMIFTENQQSMLNKRDELLESCRHWQKYLLISSKPPLTDAGQ